MGQSNSRHREQAHTPTPTTESQMSVNSAVPHSTSSRPNSRARYVSEGSDSRRSSARRSLLNLVRSGNIRRRVHSAMSSPGDSGRLWRHSKRWSKAPAVSTPSYDETLPSSSTSLPVAGPSTIDKGKQPERNLFQEEDDDDEFHEAVEEQPMLQAASSPIANIASPAESSSAPMSEDIEERTEDRRTADSVPTGLQEQVPSTSTESSPDESPQASTSRPPLPSRHFPPPGTLVIVQGVVHTTDISRTNPLSESGSSPEARDDPSLHGRTHDRLSSLLRPSRPSSSSIQPDAHIGTPSEVESPESISDSSTPSTDQSTHSTLTTPITDETVRSPPESQPSSSTQPGFAPENRLPSISSSSIDVLGTLLSVAAAATAASLLTGSSEPILSSGLAPPPPNSMSSPPPPPLPRILPELSATSRADRMRQAWGTIRERLGLRPSTPHPEAPSSTGIDPFPTSTGDESNPVPADARELMLAEMARAFNIGLGLNGLGGSSSSNESGPVSGPADTEGLGPNNAEAQPRSQENGPSVAPSTAAANEAAPRISMPPEGSFERFLVDLQLDLRVALTHVQEENFGEADHNPTNGQPEQRPEEQSVLNSSQLHPASSSPNLQTATSNAAAAIIDYALSPNEAPSRGAAGSDTDSDMPHLLDAEDFHSESDGDDYDDEDFHSAVRSASQDEEPHQNQENSGGQSGTTTSGMGRIDASGRINWWRLYRFPQITSLGLDLAAGLRQASATPSTGSGPSNTTHNPLSTPSASTSAERTPPPVMSEQPSSRPTTDPRSAPPYESARPPETSVPLPPFSMLSPQAPRSVVPVIIVGLQSVHPEWRPDAPPPTGENEEFEPSVDPVNDNGETDFGGSEDDIAFAPDAALGAGGSRARGRPRGWQSRAASAIRNLRPGRRSAEPGHATAPPPFSTPSGSRTFLIYVIGGYYPPDHSIVTGGPNNFDSFEALLELADLLGQVKPSTVSKEDIENSDLEVIKASLLPQYYKENKITANCLDRCLVCLEDYQRDEDVRVMKCRHVFHQTCVDEWMQKGRNNCPTCRSTGVQTATENPSQTA